MTLEEIKAAVRAGSRVFWKTQAYEVKETRGGWLIVHAAGHAIGLTWADGVTMNGEPEDFYAEGPR